MYRSDEIRSESDERWRDVMWTCERRKERGEKGRNVGGVYEEGMGRATPSTA